MPTLHLYLNPWALQTVTAGRRSMPTAVRRVALAAGWTVLMHPEDAYQQASLSRDFHLVVNQPVQGPNTLTLRIAGWEPFWRIEPTNDRWDWGLAGLRFTPDKVGARKAENFQSFWRRKLFGDLVPTSGGGVFVPLQGKLLQRRYFQAASPLDMLTAILTRWPDRKVNATLHPRESYTGAERAALADLSRAHGNFTLAEGPSERLLAAADLMVTQNSTLALKGFLLDKPAMLWARMDFHHIAASVPELGREAAFARAESSDRPEFARYLLWYFRHHALLAWDEDLDHKIQLRLAALGWPL